MVVSGFVSLLVALVMILVRGAMSSGSPIEPNQYAWLAISAIIGAWGVLIPAKLWQGNAEDATLRRFTMVSIGLAVGAAVYAIHRLLLVSLPYEMFPFHEWRFTRSWHGFYSDYGRRRFMPSWHISELSFLSRDGGGWPIRCGIRG